MALSDIKIHRGLPVINGFIQVPPCLEKDKTNGAKVDDEAFLITPPISPGVIRLTGGSGRQWGSKTGAQEIYVLNPTPVDKTNEDGDGDYRPLLYNFQHK